MRQGMRSRSGAFALTEILRVANYRDNDEFRLSSTAVSPFIHARNMHTGYPHTRVKTGDVCSSNRDDSETLLPG